MIRTACAWMLVLLAASPVTAPFSACDLVALCGRAPVALGAAAVRQIAPTSVDSAIAGDALSVSPLITRTAPPEDTGASRDVRPRKTFTTTVARAESGPSRPDRSAQQGSGRIVVLRL